MRVLQAYSRVGVASPSTNKGNICEFSYFYHYREITKPMRHLTVIAFILLVLLPHILMSQIEPDSLIGTYAGVRWFKWEEDIEWTVFEDTVGIININGCWLDALTATTNMGGIYIGGTKPFETAYNFCQGSSTNYIHRFHSQDSLTIIYNDISPPPPNVHISSTRFYGEKICDSILIKIRENNRNDNKLKAYPNPFTTSTTIEYELDGKSRIQITIYNSLGNMVYETEDRMMPPGNHSITWSSGFLPQGLYFAMLRSEDGVSVVKMMKQ